MEIKDIDGQRSMSIVDTDTAVFVAGYGFEYEFDRAIFLHTMRKMLEPTSA